MLNPCGFQCGQNITNIFVISAIIVHRIRDIEIYTKLFSLADLVDNQGLDEPVSSLFTREEDTLCVVSFLNTHKNTHT